MQPNEQPGKAETKPEEQRRALGRLTTPPTLNTESVANPSPAFEAWFRLYRARLEQLCERQNPYRD